MTVSNDSTATLDHAEEPTSPTGGGAGSTDAAVIAPGRSSRKAWVLAIAIAVVVVSAVVMLLLPLKPMVLGGTACVLMLALLFLRMPVALAMLGPSLLGLYALRGEMVVESQLATLPYLTVASWTLSVVPMFILMGLLLWKAGLTESLYRVGNQWLGWMPGGLAVGTNIAGAGLAAVSGSSVGTTYALARIGIPEMLKAGYDKRLAIGAVIVAGLPGQLIPPSLMLVIYAGVAEVPIGPQLLAGIGPGILVAVLFSIMIMLMAPRWAGSAEAAAALRPRVTWGERFLGLAKVWPIPLIMLIILGGTFSGTFTATEVGAVAALCAVVVTILWKRRSSFSAIREAAIATVSSVGAIFLMLIGVEALSRMLALTGLTGAFADMIDSMGLNRVEFLLLMTVVYIVLGTFMDPIPMLLLTVPILIPTLNALDIDLMWFGVFAVFMGELAVVTPPVGILAFIIHSIVKDKEVNQGQKISMGDVFNAIWYFMPMAIVTVLILIFFPQIATTIPEMSMK
ncbi:tripartite ATP-independent transporter DctM subunit [Nocardioides sp. J9]|uniref:TRAP transporter large permease n=1 Tax=unclassified Nocardioides TaxID=2615069 RepID=UPI00048E82E5|nr:MULTISPECIES: TRAP transporter large permease [unclassified Nocardioides]TWG94796.1 tripartite ATP-independent transporter DctM subunit [Nocardioides sp. J9]